MLEDFAELADPPERRRRWQELMRFLEMAIKVEERQRAARLPAKAGARRDPPPPRGPGTPSRPG